MYQSSKVNGKSISAKVDSIVDNGINIIVLGDRYFLPYKSNPWFEKARVSDIFNIEMVGRKGVRWDALDVDLSIESLKYPEKYPLVAL